MASAYDRASAFAPPDASWETAMRHGTPPPSV